MDTKWTQIYKKKSQTLDYQVIWDVIRDLDWIQTSNLLSRNQMRYSVAPRGLIAAANIGINPNYANRNCLIKLIFYRVRVRSQKSGRRVVLCAKVWLC